MFEFEISEQAVQKLADLKSDKSQKKRYKAVQRCLNKLRQNPRYPGLNSSPMQDRECPHGDTLWHSYAENNTPAAYRVFWCYHPTERNVVCIIAITPHP